MSKAAKCRMTAILAAQYQPNEAVFKRTKLIKQSLENVKPPKASILKKLLRKMGIR